MRHAEHTVQSQGSIQHVIHNRGSAQYVGKNQGSIQGPVTYVHGADAVSVTAQGDVETAETSVLGERVLSIFVNGTCLMKLSCTPNDIREFVYGRLFTAGIIDGAEDITAFSFDETRMEAFATTVSDVVVQAHTYETVSTTGATSQYTVPRANTVPCANTVPRAIGRCPASCATDLPDEGRRDASTSAPATNALTADVPNTTFRPWRIRDVFDLYEDFALDTMFHSLTRGTHSCRLWLDGAIVYTAEDIGRHNAMDKVIGYALINGIDMTKTIVFTSGRIPLDMARKVVCAHIPVLASKAAPTDEAIRLCRASGVALVVLSKSGHALVYAGEQAMVIGSSPTPAKPAGSTPLATVPSRSSLR
jgi:FdhD protein